MSSLNSRRRTISKLSRAVTGFHTDSIRPTIWASCSSVCKPIWPPTSRADRPDLSDSGSEMSSSESDERRTASVMDCIKVITES